MRFWNSLAGALLVLGSTSKPCCAAHLVIQMLLSSILWICSLEPAQYMAICVYINYIHTHTYLACNSSTLCSPPRSCQLTLQQWAFSPSILGIHAHGLPMATCQAPMLSLFHRAPLSCPTCAIQMAATDRLLMQAQCYTTGSLVLLADRWHC